jgi:TPR repeat protein
MNLRVLCGFGALVLAVLVSFGGPLQAAPTSSANSAFETGIEAYRTGDITAAVDAWTKASAGGHPLASYLLGQLYEQGHGVEKSPSLAFQYFERAAAEGQPQAAVKVGLIYRDGNKQLDIKRNYEKAIENFEKGALQAWPESQFYLADMYRRGLGMPTDRSESLRWLILAAKKRYAPAMLEMARIYFAGEGVNADRIKGWSYIELASRYADPTEGQLVNAAMDKYTKRMKPGEKDAAKRTADEWVSAYAAD